ncbi:MAG TPA: YciI family protein, partial [Longimicrobiales bacterium]|nr:YciI family protein [Longimicrobiales bacterium]
RDRGWRNFDSTCRFRVLRFVLEVEESRYRAGSGKEIVMTQYLLSVHMNEAEEPPAPEVMEQLYKDVDAFNETLKAGGAWVFAGGLHPSSTATVVSAEGDEVITTDGPYAETKEQLGGFWIIEAADLDAALDWATKASAACQGPVEVRPFQEEPES